MNEAQITKPDDDEASEPNPLGVKIGQRWRHEPPEGPAVIYKVIHFKGQKRAVFFALFNSFEMRATVRLPKMDPDEWTLVEDAA